MNSLILFQQLLVLLGMMILGLICYKTGIIDDHTNAKLSSLMVWVLNPFLMISGVIGKGGGVGGSMVIQNVLMVTALYGGLFIVGFVFVALLRYKGRDSYLYRFEMLFPNVGFMGIPLVKEMLGSEYIVLVAFYMLGFNVLCYTYGVGIAARLGGKEEKFDPRRLLNPGIMTSILAIVIFAMNLPVPAPVASFCDYVGNTTIPFSMIIIGVSLAKADWKTVFHNVKYWIFIVTDMFLVPLLMVYLSRYIPFDRAVIGVFQIMACMPIASMTCMFAQEYGGDGTECAQLISITTVVTVVSAPLVIYLVG